LDKKIGVSKRKLIQLLSALIYNANLKGFANGKIYKGPLKGVCIPGLNCYSCPGAIAACPLGSLQSSLNSIGHKWPLYIIGIILVFGILLGRAICAFLCPFGLIQELFYKIPSPKIKKSKQTRRLSLLKYGILLVFVILLPVYTLIQNGVADPAFCKYICPAGTLEGGVPLVALNSRLRDMTGALFNWKIFILSIVLLGSVFISRPFCRFLCPLGAIYSFFNPYAVFGVSVDEEKCTKCAACTRSCKFDVHYINDRECIRCGECRKVCPSNAISYFSKIAERHRKENQDEKI